MRRWAVPGNEAENVLTGNAAANTLDGGAGNDRIDGGAGADTMDGGGGDDLYIVDDAGDSVWDTGGGTDTIVSSVDFALDPDVEVLILGGSADLDADGSSNPDTIRGNAGANHIYGDSGGDHIHGGLGNDTLEGGYSFSYDPDISGDFYYFDTALDAVNNVDQIIGFNDMRFDAWDEVEEFDDRIVLDDSIFTTLAAGDLTEAAFCSGTAAQDADDRIIWDSAMGNLFYDPDGNGSASQILFATVTLEYRKFDMDAGDFVVI